MFDRILNTDYYKSLFQTFSENVEFNSSLLPISIFNKINLSFIKKAISKQNGFNIIIKIPKNNDTLINELYSNLYLYIANVQFYENYFINPDIHIGDTLKNRNDIRNRLYKVVSIIDEHITLKDITQRRNNLNGPANCFINKKRLWQKYVPTVGNITNSTLEKYFILFGTLQNIAVDSYFPTNFNSVSLFVGSKKIFDNFRNVSILNANLYNSIPCYYLTREGNETPTLRIAPLLYFVPSYSIAYQHIIQNTRRVSNIVLLDDGFDELQQIISDQSIYGFRILGICTTPIEKRLNFIKYWKWHKEEINLINSL